MEILTDEQQGKLDALLAELATLPTPELIVEAVRIRGIDVSTEEGQHLFRTAMAGGIAAEKMFSYLLALRDFEQFRNSLGREIHGFMLRPEPTRPEEVEEYIREKTLAIKNSGLQEVTVHFFSNCVMHLHKLLKKAATGAGYQIPDADLAVLNAYRDLRNYYEHIENRLPGHVDAGEVVRETVTEDEWTIHSGIETDSEGYILLKGQRIDVTGRGLERVEDVVRRTWEQLKPAAVAGAREHFLANPADIPSPEAVRQDLLVSVGR